MPNRTSVGQHQDHLTRISKDLDREPRADGLRPPRLDSVRLAREASPRGAAARQRAHAEYHAEQHEDHEELDQGRPAAHMPPGLRL